MYHTHTKTRSNMQNKNKNHFIDRMISSEKKTQRIHRSQDCKAEEMKNGEKYEKK